jgi:hypothetical protein
LIRRAIREGVLVGLAALIISQIYALIFLR